MTGQGRKLPCVLLGALLLALTGAQAAGAIQPPAAVTYREMPEGGPQKANGRTLSTQGDARYGIDINSKVAIEVDRDKLTQAMDSTVPDAELSPDARSVNRRIEKLTEAVRNIPRAIQLTQETIQTFRQSEPTGDFRAFHTKAGEMAGVVRGILEPLQAARKERFEAQGIATPEADRRADEEFNAVFTPKAGEQYDWDALRALLTEEIQASQTDLAGLIPSLGTEIEIQAHLVPRAGGSGIPIRLPGYNEVEVGVPNRFQKVRFELTPQEQALFEKNRELAKNLQDSKDLGTALLAQLRAQASLQLPQLAGLSDALKSQFEAGEQSLNKLSEWGDAQRLRTWIGTVRDDLEKTDEGKDVLAKWNALGADLQEAREDLEVLRSLASLNVTLDTSSPAAALVVIQSALSAATAQPAFVGGRALSAFNWENRLTTLQDFVDSVKRLEKIKPSLSKRVLAGDGPVGALLAARDSVDAIRQSLRDVKTELVTWVQQLVGSGPARMAADLPTPPGQTRIPFDQPMSTSFDLQTIKASRNPGDVVQVHYRFYRDGKPLDRAGWSDTFVLRTFGWTDATVASLAFTQQDGEATWKPSATLSWLLDWRAWPRTDKDGLGGLRNIQWFSGFGLSTLELDFVEEQDVELGLAATVSFLNNWILVGYGTNLQAEEKREFWFMSLRILQGRGPLGRD